MPEAAVERPEFESVAWPRILPFVVFIILLAAEPWIADRVNGVLDPRWLYGIRSGATALVLVVLWHRYPELHEGVGVGVRLWLLAGGTGVLVFVLWIALDLPLLATGLAEASFDPRVSGRIHPGFTTIRLAGAVVVVPVMEELFWRSFLMRWLERPAFLTVEPERVGWKPLVISSAVFALEHRRWFAGLLAGLLYGELYRRAESIWVVVFAHALTNGALALFVLTTGSWQFW